MNLHAARRHHAVVAAGRDRIRAVLPCHGAPLQMLMHPERHRPLRVAPTASGRDLVAALPGLLFCVELHGGIGLYRLAVKWGWFEGEDPNASRRRLKRAEVGADRLLPRARARHARGVHEDRLSSTRRARRALRPAWVTARGRRRHGGAGDEDRLYRRARDRRRARRAARGDRRQAPRPRGDHPVAGAAQALALQGRAGRHAGEPRQRHQGPGRQRGRALRGHGARQRLGRRPARSCACSSTPRPRRCASSRPGACRGAASARATAQVIINGQKVTITERDEAHGLVAQRDFGGTKKWRTCYVSDGTGHAMLHAVGDRAIAESIPVHERTEALALIHDGGRCYGAVVRDLVTGELTRLCRQGHRHRHRRGRAALSRHDQRA